MTRTRISKLTAVFLAILMTLALGAYAPMNKVKAASQADALVSVALAEEGYTEGSNNDNKYGAYFGNNHVAWCAYFISWCARQAGIPESVIKTNAWAGSMGSSKRTGNFGGQYYPKGSITPQKGDIVYYGWGSSTSQHVEIVISTSGSTFTSIGGNTKGSTKTEGVRRHSNYSFTSSQVVGYERPNYSGSANPPVQNNDTELGINYPRPSGSPLLSTGSKGSGVSWLQTALNKANNAGLAVDGDFGSGTKQAVINFQKANGLDADGIAGPATINKLVEVIKNKLNPPAPSIKIKGKVWMSDNKMGNEVSSFETGKWYYMCYKLYDEYTGKLISETSARLNDYKITETIYNPDGSVFYTCTYDNSDNNWIGVKPSNTGSYKWELKLTITKNNSTGIAGSGEFNVSESKPTLEAPNLRVDVNDEEVTFSWNLVDNATGYDLRIYYSNGTSYADYWDFPSNEHSLTITMPKNTEFYAAVCSKNSNYDECWSYGQQVSFKTGIHEHEWSNWTTTKSPTCVSDGTEKRTCSVCGESETRTISKTGNHSFGSETKDKDGNYVKICTACGYKQISPADEVTLSYDSVTGASGETVKVNLYADTHGKKIDVATISINYDKNNMELIDINCDAGCPAAIGGTATMNISSGIVLLDYSDSDIILNPKTALLTYTFKISDTAKPGSYDIRLEGSNGAKEPLFACVDNHNAYYAKLNLTVLKNVVTVKCKQHSFGSWETTKAATCTSEGQETRTCSECGEKETRSVAKAKHKYTTKVIAPTFTEQGCDLHTCSECGNSYKDNYQPMRITGKVSEVVLLQKYLVKKYSLNDEQFTAADLNNDGKVNVFDVIILKRKLLK